MGEQILQTGTHICKLTICRIIYKTVNCLTHILAYDIITNVLDCHCIPVNGKYCETTYQLIGTVGQTER